MARGVGGIGDQSGRRIIITGANGGLGAEATRILVGAGAHVIMACRDIVKGRAVASALGSPRSVEVRRLDLADLSSVRAFAADTGPVDVLVNNAGVMALPRGVTADGFERQLGTNHLGHFALTGLLLDRIGDRVVTVSSIAHRIGRIHLGDLNWERRRYRRWSAYGQSKLANLLFAYELDRRLRQSQNPAVRSIAAHPGFVATGLLSRTGTAWDDVMRHGRRFAQSPEAGALPLVAAAAHDEVRSGEFIGPAGPGQLSGPPGRLRPGVRSGDRAVAAALWTESETLTGIEYPKWVGR